MIRIDPNRARGNQAAINNAKANVLQRGFIIVAKAALRRLDTFRAIVKRGLIAKTFSECRPASIGQATEAFKASDLLKVPFSAIRVHPWPTAAAPKLQLESKCHLVRRPAAAVYSVQGRQQVREMVSFYMTNARLLREGLTQLGITIYGGENAPYVWLKTPNGLTSWEFFDLVLSKGHLVGTPGSGFGAAGEGYFRLSAFNSRANVETALDRFRSAVG